MGRYKIRTQDSWEEVECDVFDIQDGALWCSYRDEDDGVKTSAIFSSWKYVIEIKEAAM